MRFNRQTAAWMLVSPGGLAIGFGIAGLMHHRPAWLTVLPVAAALCAIQHLTKDTGETWAVAPASLAKARQRVADHQAEGESGG